MDKMILNDTPVRTSVNFGINNVSVKEIKLPQNLEKFKNFNLINETERTYYCEGSIAVTDYKTTYTLQMRARDVVYHGGVSAKEQIIKVVPVLFPTRLTTSSE